MPVVQSPHLLVSFSHPYPMSTTSKRGRKRNDDLPPNRARDVQRAFRARRAAHLDVSTWRRNLSLIPERMTSRAHATIQSLQERVDLLEAENAQLRTLLSMPPAERVPLGRGPTGRDQPPGRSFGSHSESGSSSRSPDDASRSSSPEPSPLHAWASTSGSSGVSAGMWSGQPMLDPNAVDFAQAALFLQQQHQQHLHTQQQQYTQFHPSGSPFFGNPPTNGHTPYPHQQHAAYPTSTTNMSPTPAFAGHSYQNHLNGSASGASHPPSAIPPHMATNPQLAALARSGQRRPSTPQLTQAQAINGAYGVQQQQHARRS